MSPHPFSPPAEKIDRLVERVKTMAFREYMNALVSREGTSPAVRVPWNFVSPWDSNNSDPYRGVWPKIREYVPPLVRLNSPIQRSDPTCVYRQGHTIGMITWFPHDLNATRVYNLLTKQLGFTITLDQVAQILVLANPDGVANSPPPADLSAPGAWDEFVRRKDYKSWSYFQPLIKSNAMGRVSTHEFVDDDAHQGWTDLDPRPRMRRWSKGEGAATKGSRNEGSQAYFWQRNDALIGRESRAIGRAVSGFTPGATNTRVEQWVRCDGSLHLMWKASLFPNATPYVDGRALVTGPGGYPWTSASTAEGIALIMFGGSRDIPQRVVAEATSWAKPE